MPFERTPSEVAVGAMHAAARGTFMIKLERVEIIGFKSFSDRTEVKLPSGITAVVGPNGCGKSNIGDAINWVLGEQSPKMMRGKSMSDVIFSGSAGRKPNGMAEVTLIMSRHGESVMSNGSNGSSEVAPAEDGRIHITRRLFRSGESGYLINGKKARLKDIQEILRDNRVGAKTYATIEQGRIEQILNAKPKERRLIIEEAAGVAGFKHKRRLTEMKLEATDANLLRVQDIIREVTRQINSIKRQASKARRYQKVREELRVHLRLRYAARMQAMDASLVQLRSTENRCRALEVEAAGALAGREAALAEEREALERRDEAYRELSVEVHQLDRDLDRAEREIEGAAEKISEAETSIQRLEEEERRLHERLGARTARRQEQESVFSDNARDLEDRRSRLGKRQQELQLLLRELTEHRAALDEMRTGQLRETHAGAEERNRLESARHAARQNQAQRERLEAQRASSLDDHSKLSTEATRLLAERESHGASLESMEQQCRSLGEHCGEAREAHQRAVRELAGAREESRSATARLHTLEDVSNRFGGKTDGTRTLLSRAKEEDIHTRGVVADFIEVEPEIERAAEIYLRDLLPAVILEDMSDAASAASVLEREGSAATRMLCRSLPATSRAVGLDPEQLDRELPPTLRADPRIRGRFRDRLKLDVRANGALKHRIGDALLVVDLEGALDLHREYPKFDYITPKGEIVYASGVIVAGGGSGASDGVLDHTRKIHEARGRLEECEARMKQTVTEEDQRQLAHAELERSWRESRELLEMARRRKVEVDLRAQRSEEDRERSAKQAAALEQELTTLNADCEQLIAEEQSAAASLSERESILADIEEQMRIAEGAVERVAGKAETANETLGSIREDLAARTQRQEALGHELARLAESLRETRRRLEDVCLEAEAARGRRSENLERKTRAETAIGELTVRRDERARAALAMEQEIRERRLSVQEQEKSLSRDRSELGNLREASRVAEIDRTRSEADRAHLEEIALEELGVPLEEAIRDVDPEALVTAEADTLDVQIEDLKGKIDRLGPVNILAIDEYSELEERQQFLAEQKDDLEKSIASLKETIRKMNRNSRDKFVEAFEAIRANYQEIYRSLFNGGRADLRLEEGEDMLEAGIEIFSQPPGKRLGSVQLLSGGEKAMSAIALLFAIFRYQPSPFCLLDEVDAPLDDVNVGRFTRMLRDYARNTQFILITHNKVSMESADLLYGVTMEEPGVSKLMSMQLQ
jgi:chromosome segregation protein